MSEIAKQESTHVVLIGIKLMIVRLFLSQQAYNQFLNRQMNSVEPKAFPYYASMLIDCIKFTKTESKKYKNDLEETKAVISQFPICEPYYAMVRTVVKQNRQKRGL